ncbi:MAG: hypothetical protein HYY68_00610 [Thaumarchaeota archaeon]|nr:hypothetical protein [Nitrososphaerota archaeon]MBI3116846.1 hypothetical protein [Nitrososphaerota archaeon]
MQSLTLEELVDAIRALSPEERRDRAQEAARVRYELERGGLKARLRRLPRD